MTARRPVVSESGLILSDVATADASASQHGLLPKRSGNVWDYLDGAGVWRAIPDPRRFVAVHESDFLALSSATAPFGSGPSIGTGGNIIVGTGEANHPGVALLLAAAGANTGYQVNAGGSGISWLLAGGEETTVVFRPDVVTNVIHQMGWLDTTVAGAPTDGVWVETLAGVLTGYAKNNAGPTATGTTYTLVAGTWYRLKVVLNADATLATFTLHTCADGVQVWSDTVNANIPTGVGRETGYGLRAWHTVGSAALAILSVDYANIIVQRLLVR